MPAIAYLRRSSSVSRPTTNTSRPAGTISYETQERAVLDLAARHGDDGPELVVEWGKSGASASGAGGGTGRGGRRPKYRALLERIDRGEVTALYAYSLSRLARSTAEMLRLVELCNAHRVPIRLAKEGEVGGDTPSGRLYVTVLAAVATFEAEVASERAHDRVALMREQGRYLGEAPAGWDIDPRTGILVRSEDRDNIDQAVAAFQAHGTYERAARWLNDHGVPSARGHRWSGTTVRTVVTRELGLPRVGTHRGSRTHNADPLMRLLHCSACGGPLTTAHRDYTSAKGTALRYRGWRCHRGAVDSNHPRPRGISEARILPAIKAEVARLQVPEDRVRVRQMVERDRADLEARRARVVDLVEAGVITRHEAMPRLEVIAAELAKVEVMDVDVPPAVDWSWPVPQLSRVLSVMFERITVDLATGAIDATWRQPRWRAA